MQFINTAFSRPLRVSCTASVDLESGEALLPARHKLAI